MAVADDSRASRGWLGVIAAVTGAIVAALLIQWVLVRPYRIPSASMLPTLQLGQRVLVDRLSGRFGDPAPGQIWVFHPPAGADLEMASTMCATPPRPHRACVRGRPGASKTTYIKRVVGIPGDRIRIRGGHVTRNGHVVREPYASRCTDPTCELHAFTVPADRYFMLGDNRGISSDSRFWGPVPRADMIGHAFATYWPLRRIGGL
jgi:signal peptidase I